MSKFYYTYHQFKKKHIIQHQCKKKNYPREPFYVIKIAPSPTKIIISRIVNINKNIRIVCLQSLQTIHNYQNYAYKVVYPSVYYRKKITHINYIWGLNFLVFEEINNKTQNWSNSSRAGGWTYKKKRKKSYWTTFIISIKKKIITIYFISFWLQKVSLSYHHHLFIDY